MWLDHSIALNTHNSSFRVAKLSPKTALTADDNKALLWVHMHISKYNVIHVCTHINNNMVHRAIALLYCCEVFLLCLNVTNAIKEMAYIITQHSNLTQDWLTNEPQPIRVIAFTIKSTLHSCHASELLCSCKTAYKPSKLSATNMKPHTSTSYQLPDHTQTHVMNPQLWMLPQPRLLLKS